MERGLSVRAGRWKPGDALLLVTSLKPPITLPMDGRGTGKHLRVNLGCGRQVIQQVGSVERSWLVGGELTGHVGLQIHRQEDAVVRLATLAHGWEVGTMEVAVRYIPMFVKDND